jgi:hypothetical protein
MTAIFEVGCWMTPKSDVLLHTSISIFDNQAIFDPSSILEDGYQGVRALSDFVPEDGEP